MMRERTVEEEEEEVDIWLLRIIIIKSRKG